MPRTLLFLVIAACSCVALTPATEGAALPIDKPNPLDECALQPDGTPCADDGVECTTDVCDDGICTHPPKEDNTLCADDGDSCTWDVCRQVRCVHLAKMEGEACEDDGRACTNDVCRGGICRHDAVPDGSLCEDGDGDSCTFDTCSGGWCLGASVTLPDGRPCETDGECCTSDVCSGGECTHPPLLDGSRCRREKAWCAQPDSFCFADGGGAPTCDWAGDDEGFLEVGLDIDDDGVPDLEDNCFAISNPDQSDLDGDGAGDVCDCDALDASVSPSVIETCNGIDDNCDGVIDEGYDTDGDFATACAGDCDDGDPAVGPHLNEACGDNVDNNCDGVVDEFCAVSVP